MADDPSDAVITGAAVRLIDAATSTARDTTTNDAGRYIFVNVTPGAYDIKISKAGFAQAVVTRVKVEIGQVTTANATLKVGEATETVEVTATGATFPFYRARGYEELERIEVPLENGVTMPILRMGKRVDPSAG